MLKLFRLFTDNLFYLLNELFCHTMRISHQPSAISHQPSASELTDARVNAITTIPIIPIL